MKLKDYLALLNLEENTVVVARINENWYNNGENDSISGRVEIRDNGFVFVMSNNVQLELIK